MKLLYLLFLSSLALLTNRAINQQLTLLEVYNDMGSRKRRDRKARKEKRTEVTSRMMAKYTSTDDNKVTHITTATPKGKKKVPVSVHETTNKYKKSPFAATSVGPQVESIANLDSDLAKSILATLVTKLDDEDAQGTYGNIGWRKYFFGVVAKAEEAETTKKEAEANAKQDKVCSVQAQA